MCEVVDLDHSWTATHRAFDNGRMDGFTTVNVDPADPTGSRSMGHYNSGELPFYYALANAFAIGDRYFSSVLGPTFPNRFYLTTGTSFGHIRNDIATFNQKTIFQLLDEANPPVTWKIYAASVSEVILFSYVQQHASHIRPISEYMTDAANGTLPQVAFVEPNSLGSVNVENDEHPPANVQVGEKFTHDIIEALLHSPDWSASAFFLRRHPADAPSRRHTGGVRPLWRPRAGDRRLTVRQTALRVARGVRPHFDSAVHRDALRASGTDAPRRRGVTDAGLLRLRPRVVRHSTGASRCPSGSRGRRRLRGAASVATERLRGTAMRYHDRYGGLFREARRESRASRERSTGAGLSFGAATRRLAPALAVRHVFGAGP